MKSNIEWKKWGEIDPLFGVSSWDGKAKHGTSPWTDDEFYAMGKSDWLDFKTHWNQYGVRAGTCLEIGCGVGRITKHLAMDFEFIKAVDVSEAMLHYARNHILDSNVEFLISDRVKLPIRTDSMEAVFSTHVFQHFDELEDASNYLHEIFRVLKNNGSLMIHLPIYHWPGHTRLYSTVHSLTKMIGKGRATYYRSFIKKGKWQPFMRRLSYDLDWLYNTFDHTGFSDVEFRIIRPRSNNDPHPFVLARKGN